MTRFFARKTICKHGHKHDSQREADRCVELHLLLASGQIAALVYAPQYPFEINGAPLKLSNGRRAGYKADFAYIENGLVVVEDVKPRNKGFGESRDVPLRHALFRHLYPQSELRIVR